MWFCGLQVFVAQALAAEERVEVTQERSLESCLLKLGRGDRGGFPEFLRYLRGPQLVGGGAGGRVDSNHPPSVSSHPLSLKRIFRKMPLASKVSLFLCSSCLLPGSVSPEPHNSARAAEGSGLGQEGGGKGGEVRPP